MRRLVAPILAILSVYAVLAQDAKQPHEPEYANSFFSLDKDGNLKPLERQAAKVETKVRGLGYGGADSKYVLLSEHSSVRFLANVNLQFVVRAGTQQRGSGDNRPALFAEGLKGSARGGTPCAVG